MKMYVLIRNDLDEIQKSVQAGHAVAEYLLHVPECFKFWKNGTLIYLQVKNEHDLIKWSYKLTNLSKKWIGFHEPDRKNEMTALACLDNNGIFKKLRLL